MSDSETSWQKELEPWAGRVSVWRVLTLGLMGALWWSSSRSFDPEGAGLPSGSMNLLHFVAYAVLGILAGLAAGAARRRRPPMWVRWGGGAAAAWLFGFVDELHQDYVPGRFCSFFDFLVDGLGALFGVVVLATVWQGRGAWTRRRLALSGVSLALGVYFALAGYRQFPGLDGIFRGVIS